MATNEDFQNYLSFLNTSKNKCEISVKSNFNIRSFFKYLILEKIVSKNPSDLLENPKTENCLNFYLLK